MAQCATPSPKTIGETDGHSEDFDDIPELEEVGLADGKLPNATVENEAKRSDIIFGVCLYAFCSSTLLVINKVAMYLLPDASIILAAQFLSSSLAMKAMSRMWPEQVEVEGLVMEKVKPFAVATFVFFLCLLSNTQALKSVNVETVIVVRSCSPIAVAVLELLTLGKALPSIKGIGMLFVISGGAVSYVLADQGFKIEGYAWLSMYFVSIVTEMVFVKYIVEKIPMTTWTRVYYNNTISLPMVFLSWLFMGKPLSETVVILMNPSAMSALVLSCAVGVAISYAGFSLRKQVSATSFTVVGVVCKLLTVLINDAIWSHHSNLLGHIALFVCIGAGFVYEKVK